MHEMLQQSCNNAHAHTSSRTRTNLDDVGVIHVTVHSNRWHWIYCLSLSPFRWHLLRMKRRRWILNHSDDASHTHTHTNHITESITIYYIYSIVEASRAKQALGECPWPCPNNSNSKRIPHFPLVLVYAPRHTIQQQQQQLRWRQHQHHRVDNAINSDCMRHTIFRYMEMAICAIIAPYGRCAAFYFMWLMHFIQPPHNAIVMRW